MSKCHLHLFANCQYASLTALSLFHAEVVLASLITNFEFELSDKPIFWNLSGLMYPSLGKDSPTGEMWLRLKRCGTP